MRVEFLYPEVANLYGEAVQIEFIKKSLPEAEFSMTHLNDVPAFADGAVDMIYMGPMSENAQALVIAALLPYKEKLEALIRNNCVFLLVGNALETFGQYIENEDGSKIKGLGIFNTYARRQMMRRYNSLYFGAFENMKIVGFKAQFSHSYNLNEADGFMENIKGDGLCPGKAHEGIHRNRLFATYLLGPILILNPDFAKYILKLVSGKDVTLPAEQALYEAYARRLKEYERPDIKL